MAYAAGASGAAMAGAVIAQAIKASGAIVSVEPNEFTTVLSRAENPAVVVAIGGYRKKRYQYMTGYKGFVFYTKSKDPLSLTSNTELITAKKIWIPS
jgi:hypothetical protein